MPKKGKIDVRKLTELYRRKADGELSLEEYNRLCREAIEPQERIFGEDTKNQGEAE